MTSEVIHRERTTPAWAQAAALVAAMVFPTLATWLYFVALAGHESMKAAYGLTKVIQFAFPLAWVFAVLGERPHWTRPKLRDVALGLAIGGAILASMLALYFAFFAGGAFAGQFRDVLRGKLADFGTTTPLTFLLLASFYCCVHSLLEEYYWRWFVFGQLRKGVPLAVAVALSSLAFMAHHVVVVAIYIDDWMVRGFLSLAVAVGGAIWAWMYNRSGSLAGCWASHALVDAGIMAVGYHLAFG